MKEESGLIQKQTVSRGEQAVAGIKFRSAKDRQLLIDRINEIFSDAFTQGFDDASIMRSRDLKAHRQEVERLHSALRTAQRRHFEDITSFANGYSPEMLGNVASDRTNPPSRH